MSLPKQSVLDLENIQPLDRLSELLSDIPAIVWETAIGAGGTTTHFTFLSDSASRILSYDREYLLQPKSWQEMVYKEDMPQFIEGVRKLYSEQKATSFEHRIVTGDGRIIPIEATLALVRDGSGKPVRIRGVTLDISDRYHSAERLHLLVAAGKLFTERDDVRSALHDALALLVPHYADIAQVTFIHDLKVQERVIVAATPELEALSLRGAERFVAREDTANMIFRVLLAKESMLFSTISDEFRSEHAVSAEHLEHIRQIDVRSAILTPLYVENEMFGVMSISRRAGAAPYTDEDRLFVEEFARAASYAYHRARLRTEVQSELVLRRTAEERLKVIAEASSMLSSENDLRGVFEVLPSMLIGRMADLCVIITQQRDGSILPVGMASNPPEKLALMAEISKRYPPKPDASSGLNHLLRTGTPQVHLQYDDELLRSLSQNEEHLELFRQLGIRSSIFLPLKSHGDVLGAMLFAMTDFSGRTFEEEDVVLAEEISRRAATAIYKGKLFESAQEEIKQRSKLQERLELIERVSKRVSASLNLQDLLREVAQIIVPQFADWLTVDLADSAGDLNRIFIHHGDASLQALADQYRLRYGKQVTGPITEIMRSREVVHIPQRSREEAMQNGFSEDRWSFIERLGSSSQILVALKSRRRTLGVLGFDYGHSKRRYSTSDLELAKDLASRIAAGIDNALLFAEAHAEIERRIGLQRKLETAKEEVEVASRAKDQFIAALSHELRTPLTPVLATVELLEGDQTFPEPLKPFLSLVKRNIEIEARLIDDLLDMTRIAKGKMRMTAADIDLHALLPEVLEICRRGLETSRVTLMKKFGLMNSFVRGDKDRLSQVFWNVIHNATKFTPEGGVITVETRAEGDEAVIEVRDTGLGIDRAELERIFRPFEQELVIDRQKTDARAGLGLGLAISKSIVEMHGGTIEARSDGRGKGASIIIRLHLLEVKQSEVQTPVKPIAKSNGGHILFVDDHADTNAALKVLLERRGYKVTTAATVRSGFELAKQHDFDLLVSDIGLPDGNGLDLLRLIRAEENAAARRPLKAIAVSGYGTDADIARSREAGFVFHLKKPIAFPDLERAIAEAMAETVSA